jgi:hypothetical protein
MSITVTATAPWGSKVELIPAHDGVLRTEGVIMADLYAQASHDPLRPEVQDSYAVLLDTLTQQYLSIMDYGISIVPVGYNPYENSRQMFTDIEDRHRLLVLASEESMSTLPADHPMRSVCPETGLMYNIVFRGVHDVYGHYAGRHSLSDRGERAAWFQHMNTIPTLGHLALFCETRGQNAWTNHYLDNALLPVSERPYPEQKAGWVDFSALPSSVLAQMRALGF